MKSLIILLSIFLGSSLFSAEKVPKRKLKTLRREYSEINSQAKRLLKAYKVPPSRKFKSLANSIDIVLNDKYNGNSHSSSYANELRGVIEKHFPYDEKTRRRKNGATFLSISSNTFSVASNQILEELFKLYVDSFCDIIIQSEHKTLKGKATKTYKRGAKRIKLQKDSGIRSSTLLNDRVDIIQSAFEKIARKLK